jgi:hypothetical protein
MRTAHGTRKEAAMSTTDAPLARDVVGGRGGVAVCVRQGGYLLELHEEVVEGGVAAHAR